jgi:hypothetical protein
MPHTHDARQHFRLSFLCAWIKRKRHPQRKSFSVLFFAFDK